MTKNAFLISIKPRFAEMIFSGTKTVELRRVPPKVGSGDLGLVYVSSPTKQLQGCFEVARVVSGTPAALWRSLGKRSRVSRQAFFAYFKGKDQAHALIIKRSWKLATPVRLASLREQNRNFHPPQNFQYLRGELPFLYAAFRNAA